MTNATGRAGRPGLALPHPILAARYMRPSFLALPVSLLLAGAALAAEPLDVPRLQGEMKADGRMDEAFWQDAARFELAYENRPGENTPARVRTTVYIGEDGKHLRVAFVAEDPNPGEIRAFLRDRDSAFNDDFVGMNLDTFDDQRRSYEFYVNPLGAQMDLIQEEASGNEDASWDGMWDAGGRITETGYVVEIEIPFSTLRFRTGGGVQQWGADFVRFRPREHRYRLSSNIMDRNNRCYLCGIGKIRGFAGVETGRNLEIAPTVTVSYSQERAAPGAPFASDGLKIDPGLDVKWGPSPNLTVNATLNPDFSQVEADNAQLAVNTTFALFFPEKRPFFLEGADYFSTPNDLLYTRTIADPDIGLRVTGRSGQHTYGVFVARDTVTNLLIPGTYGSYFDQYQIASNDAALRYRYDFPGNSSVGVFASERQGDDYRNSVQAVDGRWQRGAHSLVGQWMRSSTQDPLLGDSEGDAYSAEYSYSSREWFGFYSRNSFDAGFRADLGFIGQVGYHLDATGITRHWWGGSDATFNHVTANFRWSDQRGSDGTLLDLTRNAWVGANGPLQSYLELGYLSRDRVWEGVRFRTRLVRFYGEFQPVRGVQLSLFARHGDQVDLGNVRLGTVTTLQPEATLNLGRSWTVSVNHYYERLSRDGGDVYVANLTDFRLSWQLSLRQRLRLALVRSDIVFEPALFPAPAPANRRDISTQLIYSYKINPRTALYAGYADGYLGHGDESLFQSERALFLKLGYAWER